MYSHFEVGKYVKWKFMFSLPRYIIIVHKNSNNIHKTLAWVKECKNAVGLTSFKHFHDSSLFFHIIHSIWSTQSAFLFPLFINLIPSMNSFVVFVLSSSMIYSFCAALTKYIVVEKNGTHKKLNYSTEKYALKTMKVMQLCLLYDVHKLYNHELEVVTSIYVFFFF